MKRCTRCHVEKPFADFSRNRNAPDGRQWNCKPCMSARFRKYRDKQQAKRIADYAANPEKWRDRRLREKFGIGAEEYDTLLASQGGACALCRRPERARHQNGKIRRLAVDHDHVTGRVRGLLCTACNVSLGYFENVGVARTLHQYLQDASLAETVELEVAS